MLAINRCCPECVFTGGFAAKRVCASLVRVPGIHLQMGGRIIK
ncbi:hypothetical protein SJI19_03420 [Acerihabitans sp. TG2]|nr:hypothetical protein [Acerihabitans sp. TG2]MEA9389612.1 hypothetical protein [Acerihabitans sp. TG2]